ncbi:terminase small subunit [Longicatena caecimuris]|uniref:terminase small subunit n=1 Tax=Longicatena caecimuris TaxID=1796635 RepID=UPI0018AAB08F|nr:terminase small subunit [Longicatena caecimuris]
MPRQRSPNRDKAKNMYINSKGKMQLKEIAAQLDVKDTQVRKWKSQDKWDEELKGNVTIPKRNVTNQDKGTEEYSKKELSPEEIEVLANEKLTEEQRFFCLYYVKYRNKVKAYQKAFNCSYINACGNASNLFKNIEVQQTITELLKEMRNEVKLEAQDIILKKMQIAFADITDYVSFGVRKDDKTGVEYSYVEFKESDDVDGTIIHEVKRGKDGVSIKLYDSDKALDWLYDHLIIDDEKRERIKLLKAQRNKLEKEANVDDGSDELQTKMDAISGIVEQMQLLSDDDI